MSKVSCFNYAAVVAVVAAVVAAVTPVVADVDVVADAGPLVAAFITTTIAVVAVVVPVLATIAATATAMILLLFAFVVGDVAKVQETITPTYDAFFETRNFIDIVRNHP